jgi:hypothetical protein|tara:strand:- start:3027 stop:3761 length:735 start_codon:yes stop_codon:yes gene_type:complete
MINKLTLQSVINKYYLGENESVKWEIEDKVLTTQFMSANKEVIGELTHTNFDLEDSELAIFDTKKLINLLSITSGDVLLELEKTHKIFTKLLISDQDFNLSYALADLLLISKVGTVTEPEWDVIINLEKEQVSNLVKAKSALAEVDNMIITTELDLNKDLMCKFTFGDEHGHNNKITYQLYGEINDSNIKLPFNSNIFKTILNVNKDLDSGTLKISSKGLMKLEFTSNDTKCKYYLVRKESTNF